MIRVMVGFFTAMLRSLSKPWWLWVAALMAVNMVVPIFFLRTPEAKVVLFTFMLAAAAQMLIFKKHGFVRLLGLGHFVWFPLVIWLALRLGSTEADTGFGTWLIALMVLNSGSLILDIIDVARYVLGERTPSITLEQI